MSRKIKPETKKILQALMKRKDQLQKAIEKDTVRIQIQSWLIEDSRSDPK